MLVKVCGMKYKDNIDSLTELPVNMVGFIFYPPSKRYVDDFPDINLPNSIQPVGVFVNEGVDEILALKSEHQMYYVQLHGSESPEFCQQLYDKGVQIIKAFAIDESFDFNQLKPYEPYCQYFLFDTKGKLPGGNGEKFDWEKLKEYQGSVPFLLSGGINEKDGKMIRDIDHKMLLGVDLNSGFEIEPGLKNINKLKQFIHELSS